MSMIQFKQVVKHYKLGKTQVQALRGLSFEIQKSEVVALAGPSGCGKSTALNLVGCIDRPTSGVVFINNKSVEGKKDAELSRLRRHNIGFIFQSFNLMPVLSAVENVEYPLKLRKAKRSRQQALEVLEQVGLADQQKKWPKEMSGGQQQRVAIARAIVGQPSIVLADEPTANLDSANSEQILSFLFELSQKNKITMLISTHDPLLLKQIPRVLQLKDGMLDHEDLLNPKST